MLSPILTRTGFNYLSRVFMRAWHTAEILSLKSKTGMKTSKRILRAAIILLIVLVNIGCDQVSKSVIREKMDYHERIDILEDHVTITKVENPGAFLSAGSALPGVLKTVLLELLPALALAAGLFFLLRTRRIPRFILIALCFIIGGGIGNIYDRIVHGSVTDFLIMRAGPLQTGIFNLADVSIMAGMIMVIFYSLRKTGRITPARD